MDIHRSSKRMKLALLFIFLLVAIYLSGLINKTQTYEGLNAGDKIAIIIPGLFASEKKYREIETYYRDVGITPVFLNMDWKKTNFKDLNVYGSEEIDKVISHYPNRDIYFFGFSFGSIIALNNAEKFHSKGTILCSMSPLFNGDIKGFPDWLKTIILPPDYIGIPEKTTVFLYGDQDNEEIRSDEIVSKRESIYKESTFKLVVGAKHDISGDAYLEQIKQEIYKMGADD